MKICFFCKINRREVLDIVEFYKQDINALKKIDPNMSIAIKYSEINWSADVIFVWWWTYALLPVLFGRLMGKKVIITGTFNYKCPEATMDYFRRPFWQRLLIRSALKYATNNIFVSENEYEQIKHDWEYPNMVYSPHCIDSNKYVVSETKREDFLFTICWTGRENVKRKCLYEIIEAIDILVKSQRIPNLLLYIAGHKGEAFDDIKNQIEQRNLVSNIKLLGEISEGEKIQFFQSCACYLQPSRYEGFGLAIAEAMSCGAPVITTNVGEVPNVVGDGGVILNSYSPYVIANAIETLTKEDNTMLSSKAHQRIRTLYSVERRENDLKKYIQNEKKKL